MEAEFKNPTDLGLTVNTVKYPKLRDDHLKITDQYRSQLQLMHEDGFAAITVQHESTKLTVDADSRGTLAENWELAQQALSQALEHQESTGPGQPEPGGHY